MPPSFTRIAIVGTGLIGGSFAMAVRGALAGARTLIVGWDKPDVLERAVARGVIDKACVGLAEAIAEADLIYVALPVGTTIAHLPEIARHASPKALVTDAASTKRTVCETAAKCFSSSAAARFLGGHPMAGNEGSGLDAAEPELFRGAKYALIESSFPGASNAPETSAAGERSKRLLDDSKKDSRVDNFVQLLETMGARPMWMDAATHDRSVALVSHLPQLMAVALAEMIREDTEQCAIRGVPQTGLPLALAGRGLRDALRVAGSPYAVWRDIVHTNTDNVSEALDRLGAAIEHLRTNLRNRELEQEFAGANEVYKRLRDIQ